MQYVRWLRRKTGQNYYLPSEAEWEYAARAGTTTAWNTGSAIITDDANILNALGRTVPVGGYPANAFGLHDMHGNVAEWCLDEYQAEAYRRLAGKRISSPSPRKTPRPGPGFAKSSTPWETRTREPCSPPSTGLSA